METTQYLKDVMSSGKTFEEAYTKLSEELGIRVKAYPEQDTYVFNYDQIESPKYNNIVRECRSLVLNGKAEVISRSFNRFFNYGEGECEVDFSKAVALEKADGSLIGFYFNPGVQKWCFRTRGTGFAESEMPTGRVFNTAILETIGFTDEELQEKMEGADENLTFIFEFISPENRIVTRYQKAELVLLAVRETNGKYPSYMNLNNLDGVVKILTDDMQFRNIRSAKTFPIKTVEDVQNYIANLQNLEEGFVIVDVQTNARVKMKSPVYLKCHAIRGEGLTPRRIAELVSINEQDEYIAVFPEDKKFFDPYIEAKELLFKEMNDAYQLASELESQKDFALRVKDYPYSALLFTARKKCCTIEHAWSEAKETYKADLLIEEVNRRF